MFSKPDWDYWEQVPAAELWHCVALSLDIAPRDLVGPRDERGWEDVDPKLRDQYESRLDILTRHVFHNHVKAKAVRVPPTGDYTIDRMVSLAVFVPWAQMMRWDMPREVFRLGKFVTGAQVRHWPWGQHETKLLGDLDAAARKWWLNYDPSDDTTAPTSRQVKEWLMKERGVGARVAEIMAQMLRPDGLHRGPRT